MASDTKFPAIFELASIYAGATEALGAVSFEATGTVHFFCSQNCLRIFSADPDGAVETEIVEEGESADWLEETLCENCGVALSSPQAQALLEAEKKL